MGALVELGKYYEHHTKDLDAARGVVERAIRQAGAMRSGNRKRAARWDAALSHRLRRIEAKQRRAAARLAGVASLGRRVEGEAASAAANGRSSPIRERSRRR